MGDLLCLDQQGNIILGNTCEQISSDARQGAAMLLCGGSARLSEKCAALHSCRPGLTTHLPCTGSSASHISDCHAHPGCSGQDKVEERHMGLVLVPRLHRVSAHFMVRAVFLREKDCPACRRSAEEIFLCRRRFRASAKTWRRFWQPRNLSAGIVTRGGHRSRG